MELEPLGLSPLLSPLSVRVPEPCFRISLLPVPLIAPEIVTPELPSTVNRFPPCVTVPERVNVPESEAILDAEPRVTLPCQVLFPEVLRSAPLLLTPVPFSVRASAPIVIPPLNYIAPPLVTVVPAAVVSKAPA